jgi:hypothetical protein
MQCCAGFGGMARKAEIVQGWGVLPSETEVLQGCGDLGSLNQASLQLLVKVPGSQKSEGLWMCSSRHLGSSKRVHIVFIIYLSFGSLFLYFGYHK